LFDPPGPPPDEPPHEHITSTKIADATPSIRIVTPRRAITRA